MISFNSTNCPNCNYPDKKIKMEKETGLFFVVCDNCGFSTQKFKFVLQAEASWIEVHHDSSVWLQK